MKQCMFMGIYNYCTRMHSHADVHTSIHTLLIYKTLSIYRYAYLHILIFKNHFSHGTVLKCGQLNWTLQEITLWKGHRNKLLVVRASVS